MPSLFSTLDLGSRSLQTQQQGVQVAGHNIANVNNPAYTRQRIILQTSPAIDTSIGTMGTGVEAGGVLRVRNEYLEQQILSENSVTGYLQNLRDGLQNAEMGLGQTIGASTGQVDSNGQNGLSGRLNDFFASFQSLSTDPGSEAQRQSVLTRAADLAASFNQTDQRLAETQKQLNLTVEAGVDQANGLLNEIAALNQRIVRVEAGTSDSANDLKDTLQQKLGELSSLVKVEVGLQENGAVNISIGGTELVSGKDVVDTLESFDPGTGALLVRSHSTGTPIALTSGSIAGAIEARDGQIATLRQNLDTLAGSLISEVNAVHRDGYNLTGGTGADFFVGKGAADIAVNPDLVKSPSLLQASGDASAGGDNQVALKLAELSNKDISALGSQTFSEKYSQTVASLGQGIASVNSRLEDQTAVQTMLARQRDSISGVSLDEEMTDMMKFQKAYEASAKLISVVDQMLATLLAMKS